MLVGCNSPQTVCARPAVVPSGQLSGLVMLGLGVIALPWHSVHCSSYVGGLCIIAVMHGRLQGNSNFNSGCMHSMFS